LYKRLTEQQATVEAEAMEAAMAMICPAQLTTLNNTQEIQATLESSLASWANLVRTSTTLETSQLMSKV
jgi:hypothetical protein